MFTRQDALDLDAKDPLAKYRDLFVFTDPDVCYLDGNSLGRLPKSTVETINKFLIEGWGTKIVDGWGEWIRQGGNWNIGTNLGTMPPALLLTYGSLLDQYRYINSKRK